MLVLDCDGWLDAGFVRFGSWCCCR